jgi:tetratricopeptide (TPR) repeat protein
MLRLRAVATPDLVRQVPPLELFLLPWYYHLVWFGRWAEVLGESAPPSEFVTSVGLWRYARGRALIALGRPSEAVAELDSLRAISQRAGVELPPGITMGFAAPATILAIATDVLAGELAARQGRADEAVRHLTRAVAAEDALTYNEPADWYYPTRLSLGAVLLEAGRAAEAEAVYREELRRRPNSGWALFGLEQSLRGQGKSGEADRVAAEFRRAWARADIQLRWSRF